MKDRARVVIVGGGVAGASIAWHLARLGETDVLVVERHELTSGSTFHSAGLVGQLRATLPLTRMMMHSVELYRQLEADAERTGRSPGWREVGSIRIATTPARLEELTRQHGWATTFGLPMEDLSPAAIRNRLPLISLEGVLGGIWLPTDGVVDPSGLTYALIGGAKDLGVAVETGVRVTGLAVRNGRIEGVTTSGGSIEAEVVVIAGGLYTPEVAALADVSVPIVPMAHQYVITDAIEGIPDDLPQLRDPDHLVYFRRELGGLLLGGYERDPAPWAVDGAPPDFNNRLLAEDWDRFAPLMANACKRVPAVESAGVIQLVNGPEAFTPDNEFVLGETEVHGLFVAAGFCAHGIASAGGVGRVMAEWIVASEPTFDIWRMDIRRFGAQYRSRRYAVARAVEVYATYYDIHYPNEERVAGRPLRRSPAYERLAALGCVFGEKSSWERPNWFTPNERLADTDARRRPRGWAGQHWSPAIGAEALACHRRAALFDETSFSKMEVAGSGALAFLQRVCANDVDKPVGGVTYTPLCNERGGVECDLTVTRLADERFLLVSGTAFGQHDLGWLRTQQQRLREGDQAVLTDMTSAYSCLGLWGPRTRDILRPLTRASLANDEFPYLSARFTTVGDVPVWMLRVTYVGELGWEIYCPSEYGAALWDSLWEAGEDHGLVAGGYRAIDSLRVEKGYRVWSTDVTPEDTPYEAGTGFAVRLDKAVDFVGRAALAGQKSRGPDRRLRCLELADPLAVTLGSEAVRLDGEVHGRVTSGGFGFRVDRSLAFAYLPADVALRQPVEVELFGDWVPAVVAPDPYFDPRGIRIRS